MTEKLYYQDTFLREFTADIISYKEKDGEYHLVLDQTAFYPEGGGQLADRGFIGQSEVQYVYDEDGNVYHVVDELPEKKDNVPCEIDWDRRFDLMQQHTGQHLLSALLENIFQTKTIGFHMSETYTTVDTDRELSKKDIELLEEKVNDIIYQNRNIKAEYPGPEKLKDLSLRKEPVVEEDIRIVKIEGIDISPCGGTHLLKTGQVGIVSVIYAENYKGGMRITFLCGKRALNDYKNKNKIIAGLRNSLSVQNEDINSEINRFKEDLDQKESLISDLKDELLNYRVENLMAGAEESKEYRIIKNTYSNQSYSDVNLVAKKLVEYENNIVVFGQKEDETTRMIMAKSDNINELNMNDLIGEVMPLLNGNGGGNEYFAQGGGSNPSSLNDVVEKAYELVNQSLNKNT